MSSELKKAKNNYYVTLFSDNSGNCKKTWKIINSLLNRNKTGKLCISQILDNGINLTKPASIANALNKHFTRVPVDISRSLPQPSQTNNFRNYLSGNYMDSIFFAPLTLEGLKKIVLNLNNSENGGHLGIPTKVVKSHADVICPVLLPLYNKCIETGYFPKDLKIAEVIPIHKNSDRNICNNYRPISILSVFSKILEKYIYSQLSSFVEKHKILTVHQCGFRKGVSTNVAIGNLLYKIYNGINLNKYGIGVFLDLQKAFDIVDRKILLDKLHHYGVRGVANDLLGSFLSDRRQYVKVESSKSSADYVSLGTPQGSVLSPLIFLLFINDIVNSSNKLHFHLFADDTCVYLNDHNLENLYLNINKELDLVNKWIIANKLSLNVKKSVYILFSGGRRLPNALPKACMAQKGIERKTETKFLGMIIDSKLTWKQHSQFVLGKLSRMNGIFSKIKDDIPAKALRVIYFSLFHCHLLYGLPFWSSVAKTHFQKTTTAQKKAIRHITKSGSREHCKPLLKKMSILSLDDLKKYEMAKLIYNDLKGPNLFNFQQQSTIHSHNTRYSTNLSLPLPRSNLLRDSVFFQGLRTFNALENNIKNAESLPKFKKRLKRFYISSYDE